ncbi:MAG: AIR synthase-related protein [Patescibacteria group bacterium]|jgi:phosphoribosylformylglycinamidine cyclo-ligase
MGVNVNAQAGVDYNKLGVFKDRIVDMCGRTLDFPVQRGAKVYRNLLHAHGAVYEILGVLLCQTIEGLGNKDWIAEWMYQNAGTGLTYYRGIGIDVALAAVNDNIAQGAMPIIYTDEIAAGDSEWGTDTKRVDDLLAGFYEVCELVNMAIPAGESPSLRFLVNAAPPVKSAPSFSGCVVGVINPKSRLITGEKLRPGDIIIGAKSTGLHANGISPVIDLVMKLPEAFLTKVPGGKTVGEEALIPTRSYVALIEALFGAEVDIHALVPATGGGVAKVAFDKRDYTYRIHSWVRDIPVLFQFMREHGISIENCLSTFNWGIGYYIFVSPQDKDKALEAGTLAGYEVLEVGRVEEGERCVIFEPEGITLPPQES